jgi:hypothetical protein
MANIQSLAIIATSRWQIGIVITEHIQINPSASISDACAIARFAVSIEVAAKLAFWLLISEGK